MASSRNQPTDTDTRTEEQKIEDAAVQRMGGGVDPRQGGPIPGDGEIRDPDVPSSHQRPVDVNVPEGVTPGVTTMAAMFGAPQVVDEVQYRPTPTPVDTDMWVIRTNANVEDMTVGEVAYHFAFQAGVRYKVPLRVAEILSDRDMLMEVPYPFDDRYATRR